MKTCTYTELKSLVAQLAFRTDDTVTDSGAKLTNSEAMAVKAFAQTGLRKCYRAEFWTELMTLEGITPSDRLFSLREGAANEIGEIADILNIDPRSSTQHENLRHERGDGVAYVYAATSPVYVYWQSPAPNLLALSAAALAAQTIPLMFKEFLGYFNAAHLLLDEKPGVAAQYLLLAKGALETEAFDNNRNLPYWRKMSRNPTLLPQFTAGAAGNVTPANPLLNMLRGTYSIPNGVDSGTVTVAFGSAPVGILLTVRSPSGSLILTANPVSPYSATAINFVLSGITDSADYVLEYVCIF